MLRVTIPGAVPLPPPSMAVARRAAMLSPLRSCTMDPTLTVILAAILIWIGLRPAPRQPPQR